LLLPIKNREVEKYINPGYIGWEKRYYSELCGFSTTDNNIQRTCINYMEALEWTLNYYVKGCKDWRWSYDYCYPPLIIDLCKYLPCFESEFITVKEPNPINHNVQLSYVLPLSSLSLLDNKIRETILHEFPDQYKTDYNQRWAYCKYMWESHVILPSFNLDILEKTLNDIN
jgi:5'-3' exonuclease